MKNIEYSEWIPAGALVKGLFLMVSLIIVVVTFAFFFFSVKLLFEDVLGVSLAWVVLAILLLVFWNYRGLQIEINDESLFVKLWKIRQKILLIQRYCFL
jgi:hypothetical protein